MYPEAKMKKTIISWLVNASVAAFAVGALQVPFKGFDSQGPALIFSTLAFVMAVYLSKEEK